MKTEIILGKKISSELLNLINNQRIKEYGDKINLFTKKEHKDTVFFFVRDNDKIVSFGLLRKVNICYQNKKYDIKGIGGIISIEKGKGYGKILMKEIINYLKKTNKTGLGFCGEQNTKFYKKVGLKTKKGFIKRFIYKNPKTGKEVIDNDGDGIYYSGKDNFIQKVLSNKEPVYINILHW